MSMARVPFIAVAWFAAAWAASARHRADRLALGGRAPGASRTAELRPAGRHLRRDAARRVHRRVRLQGPELVYPVAGGERVVPRAAPRLRGDAPGIPRRGRRPGAPSAGTALGFALLFPALFIGGMGQGDVKMTMGFGSWVAASSGSGWGPRSSVVVRHRGAGRRGVRGGDDGPPPAVPQEPGQRPGDRHRPPGARDHGPEAAAKRANTRRKDWVRLPYGVPLCVGFLGYLAAAVRTGCVSEPGRGRPRRPGTAVAAANFRLIHFRPVAAGKPVTPGKPDISPGVGTTGHSE